MGSLEVKWTEEMEFLGVFAHTDIPKPFGLLLEGLSGFAICN